MNVADDLFEDLLKISGGDLDPLQKQIDEFRAFANTVTLTADASVSRTSKSESWYDQVMHFLHTTF